MAQPYVTTRTGSGQWLMQRVSAALLLVLAFGHFALQHFTRDAVSTGLTVATRMNDPWWQGYYIAFIVLALYHGINGVVGILRDYALPPRGRLIAEIGLWSLAAWLASMGLINILHPRPLGEVKEIYATNGFVAGASRGSPPFAAEHQYDFVGETRELNLLRHYLERQTHRTDGGGDPLAGTDDTPAGGDAFDRWLGAQIAAGPVNALERDRHCAFSSTYEYAVWAAEIRLVDARRRFDGLPADDARRTRERAIIDRLTPLPSYRAIDLH